ncbi:MAG: hypothetical protein U9M90_02305 [Patescibacteria group bacterium]|nr:hypothetical protein [Patescibacteria group bacterium]
MMEELYKFIEEVCKLNAIDTLVQFAPVLIITLYAATAFSYQSTKHWKKIFFLIFLLMFSSYILTIKFEKELMIGTGYENPADKIRNLHGLWTGYLIFVIPIVAGLFYFLCHIGNKIKEIAHKILARY